MKCNVKQDAQQRSENFTKYSITPSKFFKDAMDKVLISDCSGAESLNNGWSICEEPTHQLYFNSLILKNITK